MGTNHITSEGKHFFPERIFVEMKYTLKIGKNRGRVYSYAYLFPVLRTRALQDQLPDGLQLPLDGIRWSYINHAYI